MFFFTSLASFGSLFGGVRRCVSSLVSLQFSSTLSSGVRLSRFSLFHLFLIICLSQFVSQFISPNKFVSNFRSALVVVSGSFACSPLCVFHHLSLTICLLLDLSPTSFVSNHWYACPSAGVLFEFHRGFIRVLCLSLFFTSLCVFLLCQVKTTFHHGFHAFKTTCLPLVSYLVSLLLSQMQMRGKKSKPCGMRKCCLWSMLCSIEMGKTSPASGASVTTNMHTNAAMDMEQLFGVYGGVFFALSTRFGPFLF